MPLAIVPVVKPISPLGHGRFAGEGVAAVQDRPSPRDLRKPSSSRVAVAAPEVLHPALWRAHHHPFARSNAEAGIPSGFALLDAQLPGGGWPRRALAELLLGYPGVGEIRLMAPSLAEVQRQGRIVMLFDPPALLSGWALAQLGLDVEALLIIQTAAASAAGGRPGVDAGINARVWALEQALKSGHVGAVVAWLPPRLGAERVRRLQLAAHAHEGPAFVLRERSVQPHPSAAPLRLALQPLGVDQLGVQVLKRRGAPLDRLIRLQLPSVVTRRERVGASCAAGHLPEAAQQPPLSVATFIHVV